MLIFVLKFKKLKDIVINITIRKDGQLSRSYSRMLTSPTTMAILQKQGKRIATVILFFRFTVFTHGL